ncbi:MAG TPA: metalloregulator ArsR/SmtB family transcription factor [Rhizobiales bacterium]|nr:metalloregulator ArsR/SmtB family transcription factor [Hyphomicrobiales bacterium]
MPAVDNSLDSLLLGLRAAGERTRLRILHLLLQGEMNVKDTTRVLGQSQPRVSRHLRLLSEAGLVERYREGASVFYRLSESGSTGNFVASITRFFSKSDKTLLNDLKRLEAVRQARSLEARAYFDASASEWDRMRQLHIAENTIETAMLEMAGDGPFSSMLDLGTGTGRILELFAPHIKHGTGFDLSHEMLAIARANLGKAGLSHCQLRHGDLAHLTSKTASQDLVTIHQVLHFFDDPAPILNEAARVLAPGGRLLIVDFAPHDLEILRENHAHRRLGFTTEHMRTWLQDAGLKLRETRDLQRFGNAPEENLTVTLWLATKQQEEAD